LYVLALDSDASLVLATDQARWISADWWPPGFGGFRVYAYPPVADIQTHIEVDHNPRPMRLRSWISSRADPKAQSYTAEVKDSFDIGVKTQ
jgi:hypothetical protein